MPQVFILEGYQAGESHTFTSSLTIGTSPDCNIVLPSKESNELKRSVFVEIYRRDSKHYCISKKDASVSLQINGDEVSDAILSHGNILSVNKTVFLFNDTPEDSLHGSSISDRIPEKSAFGEISSESESEEKYLVSLYRASHIISHNFDFKELIPKLTYFFLETFQASACLILLNQNYSDILKVAAYKSVDNSSMDLVKSELTPKKMYLIYKKGKAVLWKSRCQDQYRHFMAAPLSHQGHVIGIILLQSGILSEKTYGIFTEKHLYMLGGITLLLANGIGNIRHYLQKKEHARHLEILNKTMIKLSALLDMESIYREAVRDVCTILKCTKSSILYIDNEKNIRIGYAIGIQKEKVKEFCIPYGQGLVGWVIQNGKALISSSLPAFIKPTGRSSYVTDSFLIVPVSMVDNPGKKPEIIGAICATDRMNKIPFDRHDKEIITLIARQTGIALTNASLYKQATVDFLTKVCMRGYFFEKLHYALQKASKTGEPLSVLMLDLDFFKSINDTYGHRMGDIVLQNIGAILKHTVREGDIVGRYGGEEFIVLLENTPQDVATRIANRIRTAVEEFSFGGTEGRISVTVSIGVAEYVPNELPDDLVLRADRALYQAKKKGRNCVC